MSTYKPFLAFFVYYLSFPLLPFPFFSLFENVYL